MWSGLMIASCKSRSRVAMRVPILGRRSATKRGSRRCPRDPFRRVRMPYDKRAPARNLRRLSGRYRSGVAISQRSAPRESRLRSGDISRPRHACDAPPGSCVGTGPRARRAKLPSRPLTGGRRTGVDAVFAFSVNARPGCARCGRVPSGRRSVPQGRRLAEPWRHSLVEHIDRAPTGIFPTERSMPGIQPNRHTVPSRAEELAVRWIGFNTAATTAGGGLRRTPSA